MDKKSCTSWDGSNTGQFVGHVYFIYSNCCTTKNVSDTWLRGSAFAILILHGTLQCVHYFCGALLTAWSGLEGVEFPGPLRAANEVAPHDRGQRFASKPPQLGHWVVELQFTWQRKVATFGLLAASCFAFSNLRLWPQRKKHPAIESRGDSNMQAQAWGPSLRALTLSSRRCQPDSTASPRCL